MRWHVKQDSSSLPKSTLHVLPHPEGKTAICGYRGFANEPWRIATTEEKTCFRPCARCAHISKLVPA